MKKTIFALVAAVAALTAIQPTEAQAQEGFYVGGFGGANFIQTSKKDDFDLKYRTGYAVGGSVGYKWCQGFRVEAEASYRHNRLKSFEFFEGDDFEEDVKGHLSSWSFMANALYDMDLGCWDSCSSWDIVPYVGFGIGYARQRIKFSEDEDSGFNFHEHEAKNGFAWQLIAGLAYEISPCTDIAIEYRFNKGPEKKLYNHTAALAVKYHF